nr:DUF2971 domain-containing protein [uncultured Allomuricauda sp.]
MFKYYKIPDLDLIDKLIGSNPSIKFSPAYDLNDPFELKFNLKIDLNSKIHKELFFKKFPNKNSEDFEIWKNGVTDNFVWYTAQELRKDFANIYSLTCFSENNENNLMWSHYTDNHKGICVEYSNEILDFFKSKKTFLASKRVEYPESPPMVDSAEKIESQIVKIFFNKQAEWKYENEYRVLIRSEGKTEFINFSPKLLKSVFIGSKCKSEISNKVIEICKKQNVKLYHASTMGKSYKIEFKEYKEGTFFMKSFW